MKLGPLFAKLATKLGIDTTTDEFKGIIDLEVEVPDTVATRIDSELMGVEAAKSNQTLIKFFRNQNLGPVDERMNKALEALGIEPNEKFNTTKSTFDKIDVFGELLAANFKKANPTAGGEDWIAKERTYNEQIRNLKADLTKQAEKSASNEIAMRTSNAIERRLLNKKFALPEKMGIDTKLSIAMQEVNKDLAANKRQFKLGEAGELSIVNEDGTPAYGADQVLLEADTYLDGVLTRSNLLEINPAPPKAGEGQDFRFQQEQKVDARSSAIASDLRQQAQTLPD